MSSVDTGTCTVSFPFVLIKTDWLSLEMLNPKLLNVCHAFVPPPSCLLQAIESLLQMTHLPLLPFSEYAIRSLHVDFVLEISIQVSAHHVNLIDFPVLLSRQG